jgi:integrase/recombinase XerC
VGQVKPAPDLVEMIPGWVRSLRVHSHNTQNAYMWDCALWCERLAQMLDREVQPRVDLPASPSGVSESAWKRCLNALHVLRAEDITPLSSIDVIAELLSDHSPTSVRRAAGSLSSFCDYLCLAEVLTANPLKHPSVKLPRKAATHPKAVPDAHVRAILRVIGEPDPRRRKPWPARDLAIAGLLIGCGLRASEVCSVRWGDVIADPAANVLRVTGKGNKDRAIPITPELFTILQRYALEVPERGGETLASSPIIVKDDGQVMGVRTLRRAVSSWYERAGVAKPQGTSVHAFRHGFAQVSVAEGAPLQDVQELLGHASLNTTRIYLSVTADTLQTTMSGHRSRAQLGEIINE